jgi:hypothetical protein
MTSYTTAGLVSGDVVTAVQAFIAGANSSQTGTDLIGVSVLSNPAIAETMANVDIVAGTYPSGWNRQINTMTESPSVTLGTSPVMSIRKGTGTTRVASCCLMAMYVSYYVGAAPTPSAQGPRIASGAL